jgi:hypothetical protein
VVVFILDILLSPYQHQDLPYITSILAVKLITSSGLFQQTFSLNMGGVAIVPNDAIRPYLPKPWSKRTALMESKGIELIGRLYPELLSQVTSRQIEDKSKSNGLAKAVVCTQATWFMAQCISRLAQGLPVTLFEV